MYTSNLCSRGLKCTAFTSSHLSKLGLPLHVSLFLWNRRGLVNVQDKNCTEYILFSLRNIQRAKCTVYRLDSTQKVECSVCTISSAQWRAEQSRAEQSGTEISGEISRVGAGGRYAEILGTAWPIGILSYSHYRDIPKYR